METLLYIVVAFVALFVYFLPTLLAHDKNNRNAIFALNLLLGWTFLGWVGALVWALKKDPAPAPGVEYALGVRLPRSSADDVAEYARLKELRSLNLITEAEFNERLKQLP